MVDDKRPSIDLYPEVPISTPATWEDVLRLAYHEPALQHAVRLVDNGHASREEALIVAVFMLYELKRQQFHAEVERRNTTPADFVMVDDKRYIRG